MAMSSIYSYSLISHIDHFNHIPSTLEAIMDWSFSLPVRLTALFYVVYGMCSEWKRSGTLCCNSSQSAEEFFRSNVSHLRLAIAVRITMIWKAQVFRYGYCYPPSQAHSRILWYAKLSPSCTYLDIFWSLVLVYDAINLGLYIDFLIREGNVTDR